MWTALTRPTGKAVVLAAALLMTWPPVLAYAQQTQTLLIRDGQVYINGQRVDADDVPASLPTEGLEVRYSFSGDVSPVFSIGRGLYRLSDGELVEVDPDSNYDDDAGVSVYFRDQQPVQPRLAPVEPMRGRAPGDLGARMQALQAEADRLRAQARSEAMHTMTTQLDELMREVDAVMRQAPAVGASYLEDVREQNVQLYRQLMEEWQLDNRAVARAERIRRMQPGPQRSALREELRKDLDALFSLKQENREREIEALREEIARLEERLAAREQLRAKIVEERLRALVGEPPATRERE